MKTIAERFLSLGARDRDSDFVRNQKRIFVAMSTGGIFVGTSLALFENALGLWPAAWAPITLTGLFVACIVQLALTGSLKISIYMAFLTLLILPQLNQWAMGGFLAAGGIMLWAISAPFGALFFQGIKEAVPQFIVFIVVAASTLVAERMIPAPWPHPPEAASFGFMLFNVLGFFAFVFGNILYFVKLRDVAMSQLSVEHDKSERLLLNILPEPIARRLKLEETYIAEAFPNVTILFADIVNFTPFSARLSPVKLVGLLNEIFSGFDRLAEKHGIEKIKTIGDAYMLAAGLPIPRPDHAGACVNMALDMQEMMRGISNPEAEGLKLRIGIHTGPVVAGVIGVKKFIYDLWGDAVNTASRMESHGVAGGIHITRELKDAIDGTFVVEPRGIVTIKGKGDMETFLVKARL